MGHFANAGNLVIGFVFGLLLFIVLLRVVLQITFKFHSQFQRVVARWALMVC